MHEKWSLLKCGPRKVVICVARSGIIKARLMVKLVALKEFGFVLRFLGVVRFIGLYSSRWWAIRWPR